MHRRRAILLLLAAVGLAIPAIGTLKAQQDDVPAASPSEVVFFVRGQTSTLTLTEQSSKIIQHTSRIKSVDGHDPKVVDVQAISPTQIRVHGLKSGVTDIVLTDEFDKRFTVEVLVVGDVRYLQKLLKRKFPHSSIQVMDVNGSVILDGWMSRPEDILRVVEIAETFGDKVLNHMQVGGVQQVQLKCQILEVQRSLTRRFGVNFLLNGSDANFASNPGELVAVAGGPLTGFNVTGLGESTLSFGLFNTNPTFQNFVQALREEGLLKLQSVPTVVTTNGAPASILSGGEVPIVVPAGLGTVAIEFRSFGIQMDAVPIMLGNGRVRLKLRPEVSERDFSSAVTVDGVAVPGFTVRRAETQVEMRFGETLAIGGLISRRETQTTTKVPLFGEIPWVGALFSRKLSEWSESELVILVTPEYATGSPAGQLPQGGPGQFTDYPTDKELFFKNIIELPKYGDECGGYQSGMGGGMAGGCNCSQCQMGGGMTGMSGGGVGCATNMIPQAGSPASVMPMNSGVSLPTSNLPQTSTLRPMQPSTSLPSATYSTPPPVMAPPAAPPVAPPAAPVAAPIPGVGQGLPSNVEDALPGLIQPGVGN